MRSARALLAALVLAFSGCDCRGASPHADEPPVAETVIDREATLGLDPAVARRPLARVDDEPVTVLDLARELGDQSPMVAALHADPARRLAVLDALLDDRALAAEARERGLASNPEVVRAREQVYVRALVARVARDVPEPSDEAVRAVFEANREQYRAPELRTASLIFTRDREGGEAGLRELAAGDLRDRPRTWMQVAERIGFAGPRRQPREQTGLFAQVPRAGEPFVPQPVRDAAFGTEPGELHPELVPFEDGFYLVLVEGRAEPTDIPFERVADNIRERLHDEAIDSAVTQLVAERLSGASYDEAALDAVALPQ